MNNKEFQMLLEKKLSEVARELCLSNKQKKQLWHNISQNTRGSMFDFWESVKMSILPKALAVGLVVLLLFSILPQLGMNVTPKLTVETMFGQVYVVRAADYISVEGPVPLKVGDYIFVEDPGQAVVYSSSGYELTLDANSVLEVSPKIDLAQVSGRDLIAFDEYTLRLKKGTMTGSTKNVVSSPLPVLISDKLVYSQDKGLFTITMDKDESVIRALSGFVTIQSATGRTVSEDNSSTSLLAGYKASFSPSPNTDVVVGRNIEKELNVMNEQLLASKVESLSDEELSQLNQKIMFLDIAFKQALVDSVFSRNYESVGKWKDVAVRIGEIADLLGMEIGGDYSKFGSALQAFSMPHVSNLINFVETKYDEDNNVALSVTLILLKRIQTAMRILGDTVVQGGGFEYLSEFKDFRSLSLNMKSALVLHGMGDFVLDATDKNYLKLFVDSLLADEATRILDKAGSERISELEIVIKTLSPLISGQDILDLFKQKFDSSYEVLFR